MDDKTRRSSPQPHWLEALLLVLFTFLVLLFAAARAHGEPTPADSAQDLPQDLQGLEALGPPSDLAHVGSGQLLLRTARPGVFLPAPLLATDVLLRVRGFVDRGRVRQHFHNPTSAWVEGIYVFPLPEGAAVDTLRMTVGERVIEGVVEERSEAKATYESARAEGRKAALVEQERPNVFTTSIANLGPEEDLEVEIEYQQELRYDDGAYELRFPLVVAPRYVSGSPGSRSAAARGAGWSADTTTVPDASRITPPVAPAGGRNPVRLTVELEAGFALAGVDSPSHRIAVTPSIAADGTAVAGAVHVALADSVVPADRDFVLRWQLAGAAVPRAAVFTEERPEGTYVLAMVVPPLGNEAAAAPAPVEREEIFVVDTSGSMAGASMVQAKQALRFALATLRPSDRFNVIQFNSSASRLFDAPEMAFADTVARALAYVDQLEADGGTEMRSALELALDGASAPRGVLRQVVFMTDGSVANEDELFAYIHEHLGESRLFTVGIGSAPNAHFLRRAAEFGRGAFTAVGAPQEVAERIAGLVRKLANPALTDLAVTFDGLLAEAWPARLPDVYRGEPVTVAARLAKGGGALHLRGLCGVEPWQRSVHLAVAPGQGLVGIEKLWARRKINALLDAEIEGRDAATVRADVTAVALEHRLVSPFTSLVAVDVTPSAPAGAAATVLLPVNLPAGWVFEENWGGVPQTATPRDLLLLAAMAFGCLAWALWAWSRS